MKTFSPKDVNLKVNMNCWTLCSYKAVSVVDIGWSWLERCLQIVEMPRDGNVESLSLVRCSPLTPRRFQRGLSLVKIFLFSLHIVCLFIARDCVYVYRYEGDRWVVDKDLLHELRTSCIIKESGVRVSIIVIILCKYVIISIICVNMSITAPHMAGLETFSCLVFKHDLNFKIPPDKVQEWTFHHQEQILLFI